ncbi:hypothetical protein MBM_08402 [Drepanopeziza brunnea f. sp. 'multigermtubi' MB_m1]|uniref:Uncharacterized protein n=1 Tax=Marssonina brunnea f. sp. multigermtubi (strain MB_m1) TaxID=1072389 RepID=K1XLI0_MARBU|nr:uncharacterized protein MBM_08402 [Drepanopeziza brunnea f. sp. 'multigermtubi' MB_m1]EKD13319.1 hypothetical protein MBM_08402 [Drepanopeziza brunnea f. sp. 'multigermtubi' MB_m1]
MQDNPPGLTPPHILYSSPIQLQEQYQPEPSPPTNLIFYHHVIDLLSLPAKVVNAGIVLIDAITAINNKTKTADDVFRKGTVANNLLIKTRRALASRVNDASSLLRARIAATFFAAANAKSPLTGLSPVPALRLLAAAATADPASLDLLRQILATIDRNNTLLNNFLSRIAEKSSSLSSLSSESPALLTAKKLRRSARQAFNRSNTGDSSSRGSSRSNTRGSTKGSSRSNISKTSKSKSSAQGAAKGSRTIPPSLKL